jgi:hypothetical protein
VLHCDFGLPLIAIDAFIFQHKKGVHMLLPIMMLIAIGWSYTVLMMAVAEASIIAGIMTFLLYCVVPLSIILYLLNTPRRRRRQSESASTPDANADAGADHNQVLPLLAVAGATAIVAANATANETIHAKSDSTSNARLDMSLNGNDSSGNAINQTYLSCDGFSDNASSNYSSDSSGSDFSSSSE